MTALAVYGLGDRQVFAPPSETRTEGFVREIASRRFEQARPYLSRPLQARTTAGDLKAWAARLKIRIGPIEDVRGEEGAMRGDRAEAKAVLTTPGERHPVLPFRLEWQDGGWKIVALPEE